MASTAVSNGKEVRQKVREGSADATAASDSVQRNVEELGCISEFPDEVLAKVLSCLPLKDAIRTSVLSTRWRGLWKSADLVLDFDDYEELQAISCDWKPSRRLLRRRKWFKNWVNGVVMQMQHNASKLIKFRVVFNLTRKCNSEGDIDRWLEFAISKCVESLDLDLNVFFRDRKQQYVFSDDCYNHIKTRAGLSQIRHLKSLRLNCVDVTGEILEHFIANCTVLEELSVKASNSLTKLGVVGWSRSPLPLKYLEVRSCWNLKTLVIDHALQLVHLECDRCDHVEELRIENCPALVCMTVALSGRVSHMLRSLSGLTGQLDSLYMHGVMSGALSGMSEHTYLKRLIIQIKVCFSSSMLGLAPFINACPVLHTLQVFLHMNSSRVRPRQAEEVVKMRRESIKVVEVVGFGGYEADCEFVEYVLEYFVGLERIVIDISLTTLEHEISDGRLKRCSKEQAHEAEKIALGYKSKAPATLEFVIM